MKVKLLRKVRNRYKITKVEELGTDPSHYYKYGKKHFGLPFYILTDEHKRFQIPEFFGKDDFDKARCRLWDWIKHDYAHKVKNLKDKTKTVWYNG